MNAGTSSIMLIFQDKLLESLMAHQERPEPNEAQIRSVRNWVDGKRPIVYSETAFLNDWSDLKRSRHTIENGGLESLLDSLSTWPYLRGMCKVSIYHYMYPHSAYRSLVIFTSCKLPICCLSKLIQPDFRIHLEDQATPRSNSSGLRGW